jgi:heat shock protein HtpX
MEQAFGLYTHIRANKRRSLALLIGLFGLVYVMVFAGALAGEALTWNASLDWLIRRAGNDWVTAVPWATLGTGLWILIAYRFHQRLIDLVTGGYEVTRREQPRLWDLLETLCISRGITMPKLKIIDTDALNAFATGMNPQQYSITVTQGLMRTLENAELEAVLGHELTHIRNGDVRLLVIAVVIAGVISFFAELMVRVFFQSGLMWSGGRRRRDDERRGSGGALYALLIAVALVAMAWILSIMIRFALSRSREYLADAGSVELTKNPDAMIMALRKIEGRGDLARANSAIMEMCIDNPREDFADLFDTHPPIQSRIDALVKFAGGHDPGPIELPSPEEATAEPSTAGPWGASETPSDARPRDAGAVLPGGPQPWGQSPPTEPLGPPGPWGPRQGSEP